MEPFSLCNVLRIPDFSRAGISNLFFCGEGGLCAIGLLQECEVI